MPSNTDPTVGPPRVSSLSRSEVTGKCSSHAFLLGPRPDGQTADQGTLSAAHCHRSAAGAQICLFLTQLTLCSAPLVPTGQRSTARHRNVWTKDGGRFRTPFRSDAGSHTRCPIFFRNDSNFCADQGIRSEPWVSLFYRILTREHDTRRPIPLTNVHLIPVDMLHVYTHFFTSCTLPGET